MVLPDGRVVPVGQFGPEVRNLEPGTAVLPNDVPPDEAYAYSQIQQAMKRGPMQSGGDSIAEQRARANDPQLREKVMASMKKAMAAHDAANPPGTPILDGPGWTSDPWANWRAVTGIPANGQTQPVQGGR